VALDFVTVILQSLYTLIFLDLFSPSFDFWVVGFSSGRYYLPCHLSDSATPGLMPRVVQWMWVVRSPYLVDLTETNK